MIETNPEYLYDDDLGDPDLAELFAELHAQGSVAAPAMGAELAALLDRTSAPTALTRRRDRRTARRAGAAAFLVTGLVGIGAGAAAVGVLPDPAQRVVSDVVGRLTRIELPLPDTGRQPDPAPDPDPVPDSDAGIVAPVEPEESTRPEPSEQEGVTGPRETTESPGGGQRDSGEEAAGGDEGQRDEGDDGDGAGGTSDTTSDTTSDAGEESGRASSESGTAVDSDEDSADQRDDSPEEGRSSSGDGEESDREDSGSDGAGEE